MENTVNDRTLLVGARSKTGVRKEFQSTTNDRTILDEIRTAAAPSSKEELGAGFRFSSTDENNFDHAAR